MKLKNKANWTCVVLALLWLLISLPLFVFEGDTFLLSPAILRMLGTSVQTPCRVALAALNLGAVLSAYYSFKGMFEDRRIGLLGSMLYACAPYRLDALYAKADLGESIAICFLPMVLCGCYRLLTQDMKKPENKYLWLYEAVGLSAMFQSHITTFETAFFMFVLLCVFCWKKVWNKASICCLCKMAGAFLVLNARMLISLAGYLIDRDLILKWGSSAIQSKGVYWLHYLTTFFVNGDNREFSEQRMAGTAALGIGFALCCLAFAFVWMLFVGKYKEQRKAEMRWQFASKVAFVGAVAIWMSTLYFPWDFLRGKSRIVQVLTAWLESPAEFLPLVTVCITFLGCVILWQVMKVESQKVFAYVMAAVIGISVVTTQVLVVDYMNNRVVEQIQEDFYVEKI